MTRFNREDSRTVLPQLENELNALEPEEIVVKFKNGSTGSIKFTSAYKLGHSIFLRFSAVNSASVSAGSSIATGYITNYLPLQTNVGTGYYGSHTISSAIYPNGTVTVRNVSSQQLSASTSVNNYITYITGE